MTYPGAADVASSSLLPYTAVSSLRFRCSSQQLSQGRLKTQGAQLPDRAPSLPLPMASTSSQAPFGRAFRSWQVQRLIMSAFTVFLKVTGGEKLSLEVTPKQTIAELKAAVATQCDIPAENQRLIYKGQVLKDDKTIEDYGKRGYWKTAVPTLSAICTFLSRTAID